LAKSGSDQEPAGPMEKPQTSGVSLHIAGCYTPFPLAGQSLKIILAARANLWPVSGFVDVLKECSRPAAATFTLLSYRETCSQFSFSGMIGRRYADDFGLVLAESHLPEGPVCERVKGF
jgi:hypothetical protein